MATVQEHLAEIPKSEKSKAFLFWLTVAAMGTGLIVSLKQLKKGRL
jgi:hypothetical protein